MKIYLVVWEKVRIFAPELINVHVFPRLKGARGKHSVAKIWIESNGVKNVEIHESSLSARENALLVRIIEDNWD